MAAAPRIAVVPGSFDPITNGHLDVISRASACFDEVVVAVFRSAGKQPLLDLETREGAARAATAALGNVTVLPCDGLLVDIARANNASVVVRGLRTGADFEYEWPMARMNRAMDGTLDTVFFAAAPEWAHVSATLVREIHRLGGDVTPFVPASVLPLLPPRG